MMKAWGMTDTGLVRKENQDAYVRSQPADGSIWSWSATAWAAPPAGSIASTLAVGDLRGGAGEGS